MAIGINLSEEGATIKKKKNKGDKETLEEAFAAVEKEFGKGTIVGGGSFESFKDVISTGSIELDVATGIGGLPTGKMVELIGWESSGKSTISLNLIASAQKKGIKCLLLDGENSFDTAYATNLGVVPEDLLIVQIDKEGGEKMYNVAERLINTGGIGLCIIDSQNSLQPKSVIEDPVGTSAIGKHARMLGQAVMKFNIISSKNDCLIIWVSQIREKIGVMFGSPETTQGGNALKFYCHMRLRVTKSVLKENEMEYANKTKVKIIKNKMAPPFKVAEFEIEFGKGIVKEKQILDLAQKVDIIKKWGKTITVLANEDIPESKHDLEEWMQMLVDNPTYADQLEKQIREKLQPTVETTEEEDDDESKN